jgi:hypothetical protein
LLDARGHVIEVVREVGDFVAPAAEPRGDALREVAAGASSTGARSAAR